MGLLFALLKLMVRSLLPVAKCVHGQDWKSCQLCVYQMRRDPFRRR